MYLPKGMSANGEDHHLLIVHGHEFEGLVNILGREEQDHVALLFLRMVGCSISLVYANTTTASGLRSWHAHIYNCSMSALDSI